GGEATRRMMESDVTLLPHPDSPTTASVSPAATENDTPSTARTTPSRVKKCVFRPSISSRGAGSAMRPPEMIRRVQCCVAALHRSALEVGSVQSRCRTIAPYVLATHGASHVPRKARIERVAQAVAQHVDREHGQREEQAGEEDQIRGDLEQRATLRH